MYIFVHLSRERDPVSESYTLKEPIYIILPQPPDHGKERHQPRNRGIAIKDLFELSLLEMGSGGHIQQHMPLQLAKMCRIERCTSPQHNQRGTDTQALSGSSAAALHGATENNTSIEPPSLYMCMVLHCAVQIHQLRETMKQPMVMKTMLDHTWRIWLQNIWRVSMTSPYVRVSSAVIFIYLMKVPLPFTAILEITPQKHCKLSCLSILYNYENMLTS